MIKLKLDNSRKERQFRRQFATKYSFNCFAELQSVAKDKIRHKGLCQRARG